MNICDEISVLRDGNLVMTKECKDTDMNELISAMVGRSLDNRFPPVDNSPERRFSLYSIFRPNMHQSFKSISFDVREGEILDCMVWLVPDVQSFWKQFSACVPERQEMYIYDGQPDELHHAQEAMDHGFALITEERKANGLFLKAILDINTTIAN